MTVKVGLSGFGRVGRQIVKIVHRDFRDQIEIVAINSKRSPESLAYLLKYDSCYGTMPEEVTWDDQHIIIDGKKIRLLHGAEPKLIPWENAGVDMVIEATGRFNHREMCCGHMEHGVKQVIVSAPGTNVDATLVPGVNMEMYDPTKHRVVSCASCTTNCAAPVAKAISDRFGITRGFLSTVHAYTGDQSLTDHWHKDLRRARAAAANIVPTTTGAAKALGVVIPELKGKIQGIAYRVPLPTVSLVELIVDLACESTTVEELNDVLREASRGAMAGILEVSDKPLVSSDFIGCTASAVIDSISTEVTDGNMARLVAWYDNEWGYSCRVAELATYIAKKNGGAMS